MIWAGGTPSPSLRRALVFTLSCLVAAGASLSYTLTRPAEYRATAKLEITPSPPLRVAATDPAAERPASEAASPAVDRQAILTEAQVLTSRPLLAEALQQLARSTEFADLGPDPVAAAQKMLSAQPVTGTRVVVLTADGGDRAFLPLLANAVSDVYRQHLAEAYAASAASATAGAAEEEKSLARDVAGKQDALDAFRKRYDIVSLERDENQITAKITGLNNALSDANSKLAIAAGQLAAAKKSAASGSGAASAKNDPTLADLEQRASQLEEDLQAYQRTYTTAYLEMDPNAVSKRTQLENLQKQIAARRASSGQSAVTDAAEAYTGDKATVEELTREIAASQRDAEEFATHLSAYKAMQQDLDHIEQLHRDALDRLIQLQATMRQRAPQVQILEAAAAPDSPWRPDYGADAVASLAGSVAFGLFATLLVEFIVGRPPAPPGLVLNNAWLSPALPAAGPGMPAGAMPLNPRLVELPAPEPALRELEESEVTALLQAGDEARLVCVALLMGLTAEEIAALRRDAVDLGRNILRIEGHAPREVALRDPLRRLLLQQKESGPGDALFYDAGGASLGVGEIGRVVLYAAYDAGIAQPHEVTPAVLRHTYLAFLLRQGIRLADLGRVTGHISTNELGGYMQIAGSGARLPLTEIELVLPALRNLA